MGIKAGQWRQYRSADSCWHAAANAFFRDMEGVAAIASQRLIAAITTQRDCDRWPRRPLEPDGLSLDWFRIFVPTPVCPVTRPSEMGNIRRTSLR